MELGEFLLQTRAEMKEAASDRLSASGTAYPYEETVFTEVVMEHMTEAGMTFEPQACHYSATVGNAKLRLSGLAVSEECDQLDLCVSLYEGVETVTPISDTETKRAAEQCLRFLTRCAEGRLASTMDESNDAYRVAHTIHESYPSLDQIRIFVLTDRLAKAKSFKPRDVAGKVVKLEVMDIERLWRHRSEGKPRDELVVDFEKVSGSVLPCVYVPGEMTNYDYALTAIPGEVLRFVYENTASACWKPTSARFSARPGRSTEESGIRSRETQSTSWPSTMASLLSQMKFISDVRPMAHQASPG